MRLPSGEISTNTTKPSWPVIVRNRSCLTRSQTMIVLSAEPLTARVWSGVTATLQTGATWPDRVLVGDIDATSQTIRSRSKLVEIALRSRSNRATDVTEAV